MNKNLIQNVLYDKFKGVNLFYKKVVIPKSKFGSREILIPNDKLKKIQKIILENYLNFKEIDENCHSFKKGKSIISNATPHINKSCVIKLDIKDFFSSINFKQVFEMFLEDFNIKDARRLSEICTYKNKLPQGAPTSPYISNLVMRKIDKKIEESIKEIDGTSYSRVNYTRYADDITISGSKKLKEVIPKIKEILKKEGFKVNYSKLKIQGKNSRQSVTGLIVNKKINIAKEYKNEVRKDLYYIEKFGMTNHLNYLAHHKDLIYDEIEFFNRLKGKILYLKSIDSKLGNIFLKKLYSVLKKEIKLDGILSEFEYKLMKTKNEPSPKQLLRLNFYNSSYSLYRSSLLPKYYIEDGYFKDSYLGRFFYSEKEEFKWKGEFSRTEILKVIKECGWLQPYDKRVILEAIKEYSWWLENDKGVVLESGEKYSRALYQKRTVLESLKKYGWLVQSDKEIVLELVKEYGCWLQCTSKELQNDKDVVLESVKTDGKNLQYASKELQNDKDVVLKAVKGYYGNLQYASKELQNDKDVVLESVKTDGKNLQYASKELQNDKDVVLESVKRDITNLQYASKELQSDKDVVAVFKKQKRLDLTTRNEELSPGYLEACTFEALGVESWDEIDDM